MSSQTAAESVPVAEVAAIAIEKGMVEDVDWGWVQARFLAGTSVAGLNVAMGELLDRLYPAAKAIEGDDGLGWARGAPDEEWTKGHRFYSLLVGPPCQSGSTNQYDEGNERGFVTALWRFSCATNAVAFD